MMSFYIKYTSSLSSSKIPHVPVFFSKRPKSPATMDFWKTPQEMMRSKTVPLSDAVLAPSLTFNWYCSAVVQTRPGIRAWEMLLKANSRCEAAQPCRHEYKSNRLTNSKLSPGAVYSPVKSSFKRDRKNIYQLAGLATLLQGGCQATYRKSIAVVYWVAAGLRVDR